jgi:hypothetical protein
MALLRRVAAAVGVLAGAWAVVLSWGVGPSEVCPAGGCPFPVLQGLVPVLGVLLILDSLVCFVGLRSAFQVGGALAAVIAAIALAYWAGQTGGGYWAVLVVLSLASLILDLLAQRPSRQLREQANPMNLPVFG